MYLIVKISIFGTVKAFLEYPNKLSLQYQKRIYEERMKGLLFSYFYS